MIKTLNPYVDTAKTAEIMSRYRPIAPKPQAPSDEGDEGSSLPQKIKQSPYLRNLWPQMQARPTRTRKRGRVPLSPPSLKRQRNQLVGFCTPCQVTSPTNSITLQGFASGIPRQLSLPHFATVNMGVENPVPLPDLVTLPLLPSSPSVTIPGLDFAQQGEENRTDLNCTAVQTPEEEEEDLLRLQLQRPTVVSNVIAPQAVRLVGSNISVACINEGPSLLPVLLASKKAEEVEQEIESETFPAIISDSDHRVRMVNSAYKEMVGQPECPWLGSMATGDGRQIGGSCKRISGEVTLHLCESSIPISSNGFSCMVRIDWQAGQRKNSITAFCDVVRLFCESKKYYFTWRFHTLRRREASLLNQSCNI